jgi:molybdate transport system ATP-binding protein
MSIYVKIKKELGSFTLDVEFEAGNEIVALLGASGCGKSMTLKCIAGVIKPDEGIIEVDGKTLFDSEKRINLSPQKRNVGLLFQNYALFPNMTVERNIMSVISRAKKEHPKEFFRSITDKFYIGGLEDHYPSQLSGGQQQRVALARIMASGPSIIMLDEPLSALDSYLRWHLEQEIVQVLSEFEGTTLFVSHNRDEVYRVCEKVCVIDRGKSEKLRDVKELFSSPTTLASSLLSGCKNYSRIKPVDRNTVRSLDWNVSLKTPYPIDDGEDYTYIGVRAHYIKFSDEDGENVFECRVANVVEDVFSMIVVLKPAHTDSAHDFARIRVEMTKEECGDVRTGDTVKIKIKPDAIMLLKR